MNIKRSLVILLSASIAMLFTACDMTISNLSSSSVPQNPSGIYTLSMEAQIKNAAVDNKTMEASIVIDGETYPMVRSDIGKNIFDFDYKLPDGRDQAAYYYVVDYKFRTGKGKDRKAQSGVQRFQLTNRYPLMLESNRAPTGSRIPVLGRGFTQYDKILIGGIEADTKYLSENQLVFIVPPLPALQTYKVEISGGAGNLFIDNFRIDKSRISVVPNNIQVVSGKVQRLLFKIDFPAPRGGLRIDITTDIPAGVIMEEVIIPEGGKTISIPIQGGTPSSGKIYANVPGFDEVVIPVSVSPSNY